MPLRGHYVGSVKISIFAVRSAFKSPAMMVGVCVEETSHLEWCCSRSPRIGRIEGHLSSADSRTPRALLLLNRNFKVAFSRAVVYAMLLTAAEAQGSENILRARIAVHSVADTRLFSALPFLLLLPLSSVGGQGSRNTP